MKIYILIYLIKEGEDKIKIFDKTFVDKYKLNCKLFYNNKQFSLESEFVIPKNNINNEIKLKLILLIYELNIKEIAKVCESFYTSYEGEKYMKRIKEFNDFTKYIEKYKLVYQINPDQTEVKLFGEDFVKNNQNKYIIIYNNRIFAFQEYFSLKKIQIRKEINILKIILIQLEDVYNRSYMFHNCDSLLEFSLLVQKEIEKEPEKSLIDYYDSNDYFNPEYKNDKLYQSTDVKLNEYNNNTFNANSLFINISTIISFTNESKWNTYNCKNMSNMFNGCILLKSLPDISVWDTHNVIDMSYMFKGCSSLLSLPDISKWNTINVNNLSYMFFGCSLIKSLPDISKWNIKKVTNISFMFTGCSSLLSLPNISNWKTNMINNMSSLFNKCSSLIAIPDLSKWETNHINEISSIF